MAPNVPLLKFSTPIEPLEPAGPSRAPGLPRWLSRALQGFLVSGICLLVAVPAQAAGSITVEFNAPYNLVVDSNVCSPSTYAPRIGTIGAGFCNYGDADLTDVVASIGDFGAQTPGIYPTRDSTTGANDVDVTSSCLADSGLYSLTHLGGTLDATRYVGTLAVGECSWQYWSFTYPRRENPDTCGDPVWCATNDPNDDLWLDFDVWATSAEGASADDTWTVTMRNEISASANKIFPNNGLWFNEPASCQPGETVTTNGVNYELGVVNKGFDNDGDGAPDYNAWLQPIGDDSWNPSCFRLVETSGQLQISRPGGNPIEYLDFQDQLYFTDLGVNNGVTGVVEYTFMCLGGTCIVPLTPYQEAASGFDNEKFAGDYGTSTTNLVTEDPDTTMDKTLAEGGGGVIAGRAEPGETLDYTIQVDNGGDIAVGLPDYGMPLVIRDSIPENTSYASGSAGASFACCGVTVLYSTDGGATWTSTEPAAASSVTDLQWRLQDPFPVAATGTVDFSVVVDNPYSGPPVILNTGYLSFGDAPPFAEDSAAIPVAGGNAIGDTVFRDDGTGGGTVNDGVQNGSEPVISGIDLFLYWDANGDGLLDDGDYLVATTTSGADGSGCGGTGNYCFDGLAAGDYLVVVDTADVDASDPGYRLTTPTPASPSDTIAVTGLGSGGDETVATVDYGFGPSLTLVKTIVGPDPAIEGELVTYTIDVTNERPANQACSYDVWGSTLFGGAFLDAANAANVQGPDELYARGGESGGGDTIFIDNFELAPQSGNITMVEMLLRFYVDGTLIDDNLDWVLVNTDGGTVGGTVSTGSLNAFGTTASDAGTLAVDVTTLTGGTWDFTDFVSNTIESSFEYKHTGSSDNVVLYLDAVGLRVTTDELCGAPSENMQTVPLTDTYDADLLVFNDASPAISGGMTAGTSPNTVGTLTWDLGPLNAGQTKTVTVTFVAQEQDSNANGESDTGSQPHVNTADVTGALFFDGGPVNDASDTASHTVTPTGSISGYVWADSGGDPQVLADVNDGQFDSPLGGGAGNELGLAGVTVELIDCGVDAICGNGDDGGVVATTTTDADGAYSFTGLADGNYGTRVVTATLPGSSFTQYGDPDAAGGVCGTCDDQTTSALVIDLATDDGANFEYTNVDFGYDVPAVVFGHLWEDTDGDGVEDPGEGPLAGVTVELQDGVCIPGSTCPTVTTDASGDYRFEDVAAGTYTVVVDTTTGPIGTGTWNQTFDPDEAAPCGGCDDTKASFTVVAGNVYGTYDFAYQEVGNSSIGDTVYADWDGDGTQDAGEEVLENVTIYLYEDENGDGIRDCGLDGICDTADDVDALRAVTTTGADGTGCGGVGNYCFTGLPAGDWIVVVDETDPDFTGAYTLLQQTQDPDEVGVVCSTCDGTGSVTTDGTNPVATVDFGYQPTGFSSIGDLVWEDANADGLFTEGENGLINVLVTLYEDSNNDGEIDAGDAVIGSMITDGNGNYTFYDLPAGNYLVDVDEASASIPLDPYGNIYVLSGGSDPADVTLGADEDYVDADFGFAPGGVIGDTVFQDDNTDGDQGLTEPGINNVTVELYLDVDGSGDFSVGDTLVATTVTANDPVKGDGFYQFTGLDPADYVVVVDLADPDLPGTTVTADPDGTYDGETGVTLSAGQTITFADFGVEPPNVIGDYVWLDENGDGVQDPGEAGISGLTVTLYEDANGDGLFDGGDLLITSTLTDGDGFYTFANLSGGLDYVVVVTSGAQYQQTGDPDEGATTCSTCDGVGSALSGTLSDLTLDFGYQLLPVLVIDKDTTTPTVYPGGQATYTIRITNIGGTQATLAQIDETLPSGSGACAATCFTYASHSTALSNAAVSVALPNPTVGDTALSFGQWTIQAGGSVTVTIVVDVAASIDPGTYDNDASATFDSNLSGTNDAGDVTVDDVGATAQDADTPTGLDPEADEDVTIPDVQLAITKAGTIIGDAGNIGQVDPGEVIEWVITATNNGTATANDVEVTDAVPTGTTHTVMPSTNASDVLTPFDVVETFADDFEVNDFPNGDDGSVAWTAAWTFTGAVSVDEDTDSDFEIGLSQNDVMDRSADLSTYDTAVLTFDVRRVLIDSADDLAIILGATTLDTLTGDGLSGSGTCTSSPDASDDGLDVSDASYLSITCSIPGGELDATGDLSLDTNSLTNGSEFFYIDNVLITTATRNAAALFAGDAPSALVPSSDGHDLLAGEVMTVTFRVTADNPAPVAQTEICNEAFLTSDETPSPLSAQDCLPLGGLPTGSIAGIVWDDNGGDDPNYVPANEGNGSLDPNEPLFENIRVELYDSGNNLIAFTLTDSSGAYQFDALPDDTYRVVVVESTLPPSYLQTGDPDEVGTCATCNGESTQVVAGGANVTGVDFGYLYQPVALPVSLSSFKATAEEGGTRFTWTTDTETNNVGFFLYAEVDGEWVSVNEHLLPSHVIDSVERQGYGFFAEGLESTSFVLADVDGRGRAKFHGPFGIGDSAVSEPPAVISIPWKRIRDEHEAKRSLRTRSLMRGATPAVRLKVRESGLYRVSFEDLSAAGIDLSNAALGELALRDERGPIPVHVNGDGNFGPGEWVEFYGEARTTLYSDTNVYTLRVDPQNAVRISEDGSRPPNFATPSTVYRAAVVLEKEDAYTFAPANGDPWYDVRLAAINGPASVTRSLEIEGLDESADDVRLMLGVWGFTDWPGDDHHVVVEVNGTVVADEVFDGHRDHPIEVDVARDLLVEGANELVVRLPHDLGVPWDLVALDSYGFEYERALRAPTGHLVFTERARSFLVTDLPSADVLVYRLAGGSVQRLSDVEISGGPGAYAAEFVGDPLQKATYLVATSSTVRTPELEVAPALEDIHTGPADFLVISHADFLGDIGPLVDQRRADGYQVQVVDVQQIYEHYSGGIMDAEAIREFIAYAAEEKGTRFVLLVGGDSYDYKDYKGLGSLSFVPSLYAPSGDLVTFAPADPLLGDVDGDGVPEVAVGRFPVRTSAETASIVAKTLSYATKDYGRTALSATDRTDPAQPAPFATASDRLIGVLDSDWSVRRADIDVLGLEAARQEIIDSLNEGTSFAQYFGHSSFGLWSFERLFQTQDAIELLNEGRPTVVAQWGCWNTYYVTPTADTMGHALMLSGDNGAAAVLGAATLTQTESDLELGKHFLPLVVQPGRTIGEALVAAKRSLHAEQPGLIDVLVGWTILGDPTLILEPGEEPLCVGDPISGDADSDGFCNDVDFCLGDDVFGDADGDGICEDVDTCLGGPDGVDADGDGVCDFLDVCSGSPDTVDADLDGVPDGCDLCLGDDALGDEDGDGICGVPDPTVIFADGFEMGTSAAWSP